MQVIKKRLKNKKNKTAGNEREKREQGTGKRKERTGNRGEREEERENRELRKERFGWKTEKWRN